MTRTPRLVNHKLLALVLLGSGLAGNGAAAGDRPAITGILPHYLAAGRRFVIVDIPAARLRNPSVATFRSAAATFAADLRENRKGCAAAGRIPLDAPNGVYDVDVQPADGTAFGVGQIVIRGGSDPQPAEASVAPTHGGAGTTFTITDPVQRMLPSDICAIYAFGESPDSATMIGDAVITASTVTGTIPVLPPGLYLITVRPSLAEQPRFPDLVFNIDI